MSSDKSLHKLRESQQLQFLMEYSDVPQKSVVCFIDLINSTEIASALSAEKMVRYYEIFLNSIAQTAERHHANVVKNLGDSILFHFPGNKSDLLFFENCLDCCMDIMNKKNEINSQMNNEKLPNANYRISLDYGDILLGKTSTSYVDDIIGEPVDRCYEMDHFGSSDDLVFGENLYNQVRSSKKYKHLKLTESIKNSDCEYSLYSIKKSNS